MPWGSSYWLLSWAHIFLLFFSFMTVLDIVSLEFVRLKERKSSCNGQTLTMERSRKRQGKCSSSIPCLCPPFSFLFLLWRTQGILHRMLHFSLESFCWDLLNINFKREETEVPWKDSKSRNEMALSGEDELIFSFNYFLIFFYFIFINFS